MEKNPVEIIRLPAAEWAAYKALRLAALLDAPYAFSATYQENLARPDSFWQNRLAEAAEGRTGWLLFAREIPVIGLSTIQFGIRLSQDELFSSAIFMER